MKSRYLICAMLMTYPLLAQNFEAYFKDKTMRLDYYHLGNADEEHLSLDRIVSDGPWPSSKTSLIDKQRSGLFLCEVYDEDKQKLLFSYGFATIFGEWQTTADARKRWGVFHESLRIPWPTDKITVVLQKRDKQNKFRSLWEQMIDPKARHINPTDMKSPYPVHKIIDNGPAQNKVDLLLLGDGYSEAQLGKYHSDAKRLCNALFRMEPFQSRSNDFNVYLIDVPSQAMGVSRPHEKIYKRSALDSQYSSFDSQRYVLNYNNRTLRDIASAVPYEYMVILVNEKTYGGGGIYRWQATTAADNSMADYLFVHEFGHHFAGLADEYYTSSIAYELSEKVTVEPWEPNITALLGASLKWADLADKSTPIPTPWQKETFEKHSMAVQAKRNALRKAQAPEQKLATLFDEQKAFETDLLSNMKYAARVGAFEGAGYRQKGYYRSSADCIMFTRNDVGFCPVCKQAINSVINYYTE